MLVAAPLGAADQRDAKERIPHAQDKPPGPALSPDEAMAKMTVPDGFRVELVASEPDIVNPVAMTFDERGRIWITESLEYPRLDAGPGRDRIKVLEDTDHDGRADRFSIFAEGLNIPSGIAVGYGGVWVANSPDILFLQDTDGDGRADKQEVVVTGFGRDDTHELPNSLTWGPDGWLYGLNGVFNPSVVEQAGKKHAFTCALFRIHPRTRAFQLFAEGTSNPWGVAWDSEGSAFVSACVIDHLWHLTETGYYIRQGGPYPPFVKPMRSIVEHKHQKAAYCGIHYFDSDAYPAEYRGRLYMGNIHGNGVNVDVLTRNGSTYQGTAAPDFLSANDAWFMPVVQKTGPDGCLCVLDWYDRYHCYQDARRDPQGIDRLKGRLYRIRYQDSPRAGAFNLATETDAELIERLRSPNVFYRDIAQRLLAERNDPQTRPRLERLAADRDADRKARMHALWALVGGGPLSPEFHRALLADEDPGFRAWGVRAAGNYATADGALQQKLVAMASDASADVRVQVAVAARKLPGVDSLAVLLDVLSASADDPLIPHIVWQNLHPLLEMEGERFFALADQHKLSTFAAGSQILDQAVERVIRGRDVKPILALIDFLRQREEDQLPTLSKCLTSLAVKLRNHEVSAAELAAFRARLEPIVEKHLATESRGTPLHDDCAILATSWRDPRAVENVRAMLSSASTRPGRRTQALHALVAARDENLRQMIEPMFADAQAHPVALRRAAIEALGHLDAAWVAEIVLANYPQLEPELRPVAVELLCERRGWAEQLLDAIGRGDLPASVLNGNQVRQLMIEADPAFAEKVKARWGSVRNDRDPKREQVVAAMRSFVRKTPGDAVAGQAVFERVCGQCHKLHGKGQDVGPDITLNGRNSFEQLLSNVFDPSLVIGAAYQARTVLTADGRVLTGLVAEESAEHLVLKMQGGKLETIARADVEEMKTSSLSLMPEDLEQQLKPQELADLFALLTLDKPPSNPAARRLPGAEPIVPRAASDPAACNEIVGYVAPGFVLAENSPPEAALLAEYAGRDGAVRTGAGCVLERTIDLRSGKRARLIAQVSHEDQGSWQLVVDVNGAPVHSEQIGNKTAAAAWRTISIDLTNVDHAQLGTGALRVRVTQQPVDGQPQAAYWGQLEIVTE